MERLRADAEPRLSLVALEGEDVVGHVFFSPVRLEAAAAPAAAQLSPVGVPPVRQGEGIGSRLIREGLARCPSRGWSAVFLVGNPLYYARFGFRMAGPEGWHCPGPHDPALQLVELEPGALPAGGGQVYFHPAFDEID